MRVLILNQCFHPDVVPIAQYARDLAAALAGQGHSVTVVASRRAYADPSIQFPASETWRGCTVRRVRAPGLGKRSKWRRIFDSVAITVAYSLELLRSPRFDVVVAMTHPPMISVLAALAIRIKSGRLVSWIMDLNPDEAIAMGWLSDDSRIAKLLHRLLAFSLQSSTLIVVLDRFMRDRIVRKGISPGRIMILPPWSQDTSVKYDPIARVELRKLQGWTDQFVVMYAGNISTIHPLDTLLQVAQRLRSRTDITFCFVGGGNALVQVQEFARAHALTNVCCLPHQPASPLSASDLQVVVMGDKMVGIVHPCKIYNILSMGIPFLHIGPRADHISDMMGVLREPGSAYSVDHGDVDAADRAILDAAARRLGRSAELRRLAARFSEHVLLPEMISALHRATDAAPDEVPVRKAAELTDPHVQTSIDQCES
jgi:glycosyltransferase involved in cell wall biosynthesis